MGSVIQGSPIRPSMMPPLIVGCGKGPRLRMLDKPTAMNKELLDSFGRSS